MKTIPYPRLLTLLIALLLVIPAYPLGGKKKKEKPPYRFTIEIEHPRTPVKNQGSSSTCWSFSTISMLESEMIRIGKPETELSVMHVVRNTYCDKATQYVRWHGNLEFGPGGANHDVINSIRRYGIVPLSVYTGNQIGENRIIHGEMDAVLKAYADGIVKNPNRKLSPVWKTGFENLIDAYLGEIPESFEYKGTNYTPASFAASLGLNLDDYVEISSFNHHPFYETFVLEVPDNWVRGSVYNVPVEDLERIVDHTIRNGYTVAWAADLDKGFNFTLGVGVVPPDNWDGKTFKPGMEPDITQERRQMEFNTFQTTDDHGMHLVGIAHDQDGNKYYLEKNSWGMGNQYKGYSYISAPYVKLKTTCIMVNKNGIPADIREKLGI
ncbi:MAG: aminopeptidase [Bacteroidales bacterium]|nr:aminopeptidase [Bacteroidales bacterium]